MRATPGIAISFGFIFVSRRSLNNAPTLIILTSRNN